MRERNCRARHPGTQYLCMFKDQHTEEHKVFFGLTWPLAEGETYGWVQDRG